MADQPDKENSGDQKEPKTIAEFFFYLPDPAARRRLEEFRIEFEAEFGETDITKRWTSALPDQDQQWLRENHPKRYWDGLPPFVQAFLRRNVVAAARVGKLDDMSDQGIKLYLSGQMNVRYPRGDEGWQR